MYTPSVSVLGAATYFGQSFRGVAKGPAWLRNLGLLHMLRSISSNVADLGDCLGVHEGSFTSSEENELKTYKASSTEIKNDLEAMKSYFHLLFQTAANASYNYDLNINLGGDHSIARSTVAASLNRYQDLAVLWIDAHGDINTPQSSPTQNLHGMPLAGLLGLIDGEAETGFGDLPSQLNPEKLALIGVRNLDEGEKEILNKNNIPVFTDKDVSRYGIRAVLKAALQQIDPQGCSPLHISFDVDSVDPQIAPATGVPEEGGLTIKDVVDLASAIGETSRCVAMDLVEFNVELAQTQKDIHFTAMAIFSFVQNVLRYDNRFDKSVAYEPCLSEKYLSF